ncbi:28688_t:CDS:2 [Racocetra persica]|uniref:28688_t:CDS:1 n=1 Tax=Racocetra persica TaxID=160502 RepID=A0ACA9LZS8_9GLOM|nr:28688_t:CDS:2 [Racocetra persica]
MSRIIPSTIAAIVYQGIYLLAGIYQTLTMQYLYYQGAATLVGILLMPAWFAKRNGAIMDKTEDPELDMVTKALKDYQLLPEDDILTNSSKLSLSSPKEVVNYCFIFAISLLEIMANFTLTLGLFYVGSGTYQVIHSSIIIWCAILSFLFLGRKLSRVQSLCVIGVCIGIFISSLGISKNSIVAITTEPIIFNSYHIPLTMIGLILTSLATFGSACVYVILDQLLTTIRVPNELPPSPAKACFLIGTINSCLAMIYIVMYTIPNWKVLIIEEIEKKSQHVNTFIIIISYLMLILASFFHNFAAYWVVKHLGDIGQCFTIWRGFGAFVVIGCVIIFSFTKLKFK